jgi:hypothetical protein
MDEIKAKVSYQQTEIPLDNQGGQMSLFWSLYFVWIRISRIRGCTGC